MNAPATAWLPSMVRAFPCHDSDWLASGRNRAVCVHDRRPFLKT